MASASLLHQTGNVLGVTALMLASAADEIIWLVPFVAGQKPSVQLGNGALFVITFWVVVLIAYAIGIGNVSFVKWILEVFGVHWNPEIVVEVTFLVLLATAIVYLWWEWRNDDDDDESDCDSDREEDINDDIHDTAGGQAYYQASGQHEREAKRSADTLSTRDAEQGYRQEERRDYAERTQLLSSTDTHSGTPDTMAGSGASAHHHSRALPRRHANDPLVNPFSAKSIFAFVSLTFLGALDELTWLPTLFMTGNFSLLEALLGATLSSVVLVFICIGLGALKPLHRLLKRVPLFAFLSVFFLFSLVRFVIELAQSSDDASPSFPGRDPASTS